MMDSGKFKEMSIAADKDLRAQLQGKLVRMEGRAQEEHQARYAVAEQMASIQQERNSAQRTARHWQEQYHAALAVVISANWFLSVVDDENLPDVARDAVKRLSGAMEIFSNRHATDIK